MQKNDPDALIRRLWRLRERLSSPVGSVPYIVSGGAWADSCMANGCNSVKHYRSELGVERCSRCGTVWWETESKVPKGKRPKGGSNPMERAYHDLAHCVAILNHVPEPGRTLFEHHHSPAGGGMRYALDAARKLGVLPHGLSEYGYWSRIRQAREIIGLRLSYAEAAALALGGGRGAA